MDNEFTKQEYEAGQKMKNFCDLPSSLREYAIYDKLLDIEKELAKMQEKGNSNSN